MSQVYGSAMTPSGKMIPTTMVATDLKSKQELRFSIKNTKTVDIEGTDTPTIIEDVIVKPAVWSDATELELTAAGTSFESKKWGSKAKFDGYYLSYATQWVSLRMETDNVENYNGELSILRVDPTGEDYEINISLAPYKVESSKSDGFSNALVIPASDLTFLMAPNTEIRLSSLQPNSKINFYIMVAGEERAIALSEMDVKSF